MTGKTQPVGGQAAWETFVGEGEAGRWARPIVRYWGFLFLGFLFLVIWLPSRATPAGLRVLRWGVVYFIYLIILEILCRQAKNLYETTPFQLFRIHFNLTMFAILALVAPPTASSYLWFFFAMPLLGTLGYFGRSPLLLIVYLEVCVAILIPTLTEGWPTLLDLATMVAKDAILGLLTAILYFFVHLSPRLREESALFKATSALMEVLDREELAQLLADAAKAGVHASDAAVVHLLGGEGNQTLVPMGSSHLDLTILGRTPMVIGEGIAGHAIQNRETINVPNVNGDDRYLQLHPSFTPFTSLLVAPMYVGYKNVGTISVNGAKRGAFDERDERFLTALAAQGATAIANAELYDTRKRRRQQISDILKASLSFGLNQPLDTLLETIAEEVCRCSGYRMAVVNLFDEASGEIVVRAMAGVPPEGRRKLEGIRTPLNIVTSLLQDQFRISRSYFIRRDRRPEMPDLNQYTFTADLGERKLGEWHQGDMLIVPIQTQEEQLLGHISVDDPSDRQLPSLDTVQALELLTSVAATAIQNARLYDQAQKEIAERKRVEEALQGSEERYRSLFERVPVALYRTTPAGRILDANPAMAEMWGYPDQESFLAGSAVDLYVDPEDRQRWQGLMEGKGFVHQFEAQMRRRDGTVMWVRETARTVQNAEGGVLYYEGSLEDITERKRAQHEVEERRLYLEGVLGAAPDAIVTLDARHQIVEWNAGAERLFGYSQEEAIGQDTDNLVTNPDTFDEAIGFKQIVMGGKDLPPVETVRYRKDGSPVDVIVAASPILVGDELIGTVVVYTDITDRKQQETRLQEYLSTVTSSLAQYTSLEGLYKFIIETGMGFLSVGDCSLFLADDENDKTLELVAEMALSSGADRPRITISTGPGCGLVAHVAETRQPICLLGEKVFQHPSWNKELWTRLGWDFDPEHDHSLLAAPMCAPVGRLVGVLVARDSESQEGFSEFDAVLIQTLATNAAADIERVRSLEKAREDAIRAERKRLETDLHEAMNILATGVRWEAEILSDEMERNNLTAARIALKRLQAARTRAYADLRSLLEDLRDPTLEQKGLLIALKKSAELIGRGRVVVHGDFWERLPPEIEGVLYRVGQEAISNAVEHSGVVHDPDVKIEVWLERSDGQVKLCVKDDGVGFDVESTLALSYRWGLRRLRDTLREMGGNLDIDSAPGQGATSCATIDLTRRSDAQ
jgi:PAS domain S-box-containing protein